jgi:hypothetical protein
LTASSSTVVGTTILASASTSPPEVIAGDVYLSL